MRFLRKVGSRLGQPLSLHIGVHTGPVVAGSLGTAGAAAYAVTGDTVNTTARLLAAASGCILVSQATYALAKHRFTFEPARELALRGKAEPVVVHRLTGVLAEFAAEAHGYTATRHQREVGTGYFDAVSLAISGGLSSTTALKDSTEAAQFKAKPALQTAAE